MESVSTVYRVFDHDEGTLQALAIANGFVTIETRLSGNANDERAAELLLNDSDWKIALVHINKKPWEDLCVKLRGDRVLIRFSTDGFAPIRPQGTEALCLHCISKIDDLEELDFEALMKVFNETQHLSSIREGVIDGSIRQLIAFERPNRLLALHILLKAVLAVWASDPGHPQWEVARKRLGIATIPPLPNRDMDKCGTFWRYLGLDVVNNKCTESAADSFGKGLASELGVKKLTERSAVKALVDAICTQSADSKLDDNAVAAGIAAIGEALEN